MKRIIQKIGRRRWYGDDFLNIQNESFAAIEAHFGSEFKNVVLSGCIISGSTISAGIVLIDGVLCRYLGESSVSTPRYLRKVETETESENYETGGSQATYKTVYAVGQSTNPGGEFITIAPGARNTLMEQIGDNIEVPAAAVNGTLATSNIPNLDASKVTSGILSVSRIPNLDAAKITTGTLSASRIPNLSASKLTSGFISNDRIAEESLPPSKIAVGGGTFDDAVIPNLSATRITSGVFSDARIPNLNTSKITAGTFVDARLPINARGYGTWQVEGSVKFRESPSFVHVVGILNNANNFISLQGTGVSTQNFEYGGYLYANGSSSLSDGIVDIRIINGNMEAQLSAGRYQGGIADYNDLTSGERGNSEIFINLVFEK